LLIAFIRGDEEAIKLIEKMKNKGEILSTTWINSCEIFKGAYSTGSSRSVLAVHNLLSSLEIFLPTPSTSELYAQIYSKLRHSGKLIGDFDIMIAAICIENNLTLVTRDKDFSNISGMSVKYW